LLSEQIRNIYDKISETLDAGTAANHMYQQGALNKKEFEEIQKLNADQPTSAAQQLLNLVLSQTKDFIDCFLDSLMKTDQLHVYQWIILEGLCSLLAYILNSDRYLRLLCLTYVIGY